MNKNYKKWIWGGLGWAIGGPIGGILGYALGTMGSSSGFARHQTRGGDFLTSILILFASVMKADGMQKKSELEYVKRFLVQQVGLSNTRHLLQIFKNILKQDFSLEEVCAQIKKQMDKPSRLQLIHILFGLSQSDGEVHVSEIKTIKNISQLLGINSTEYDSIQGICQADLDVTLDGFTVNGKKVCILAERDPSALPWKELGVDIVVESTGIFTKRADAEKHLKAGAKKVVISAPSACHRAQS